MKLVVDSLSLAKRYILGYGGEKPDHILQDASELVFCIILVSE